MAAILNPPALNHTSMNPTPSTALPTGAASHAEVAGALLDRSIPVAPWNRAEARADRHDLRPARHLRLVTEPAPQAVQVRRRPVRILLAGLGLAALVAFAAMGVLPFLGADAAAVSPASSADTTGPAVVVDPPAATTAEAPVELIVQPGDSLWSIARRLQPRGDLRQLVDRLIERVGGTSVTRGQHIDVSGLID